MAVMIRFRTSTGCYAVPVEQAVEVRAGADVRPLPAPAPGVEGVVERDGHVVTVVNTLGTGAPAPGGPHVLVLGTHGRSVGVLADDVGVVTIDEVEPGPAPIGQQAGLVDATIRHDDELLFVVNVGELTRQVAQDMEGSR